MTTAKEGRWRLDDHKLKRLVQYYFPATLEPPIRSHIIWLWAVKDGFGGGGTALNGFTRKNVDASMTQTKKDHTQWILTLRNKYSTTFSPLTFILFHFLWSLWSEHQWETLKLLKSWHPFYPHLFPVKWIQAAEIKHQARLLIEQLVGALPFKWGLCWITRLTRGERGGVKKMTRGWGLRWVWWWLDLPTLIVLHNNISMVESKTITFPQSLHTWHEWGFNNNLLEEQRWRNLRFKVYRANSVCLDAH